MHFILLFLHFSWLHAALVLPTFHTFDTNVTLPESTILWSESNGSWSASLPLELSALQTLHVGPNDFILAPIAPKKAPKMSGDTLKLQAGWNHIAAPREGIDVLATFEAQAQIRFVFVYDPQSGIWAGYSPKRDILEAINQTRILLLRAIEPEVGLFIYAEKAMEHKSVPLHVSEQCLEFARQSDYATLTDSGMDADATENPKDAIALQSRYLSHYRRGIYSDSRQMLIYPKIKTDAAATLKYAPADPATHIRYAPQYAEKSFYIYDFMQRRCYIGVFPSKKVPPFGTLKVLK
ncbi:MAG: hypothetical protein JXK05_04675 [Campylobacterales bacterium]|nr:hypothetical protein [Campylobacterales bacterium]